MVLRFYSVGKTSVNSLLHEYNLDHSSTLTACVIVMTFTPWVSKQMITEGTLFYARPWDYEMRDDPGASSDYELYEEFASNYGYSNNLLPFLQSHFKPCPSSDSSSTSSSSGSFSDLISVSNCRPFYMPCKSELACAISCRVNDYSCGKCSETNSFRKVCQCCDTSEKSGSGNSIIKRSFKMRGK